MKYNFKRISILVTLPAVIWSCSKLTDNSAFSDMLGKDYNQQILWDVDSLAFKRADWNVTDLGNGAEMRQAQIGMLGGIQSVSYITYPSRMFITKIASSGDGLKTAGDMARDNKAVFAINGGPFDASGAASFLMIDGKVISDGAIDSGAGALGISEDKDGSTIEILSGATGAELQGRYTSAMTAGQILVKEGKEQAVADTEENNTRKARSIVGIDTKGNYIMAVIDGNISGQADGATVAEAAYLARMMGMQEAIYLSGGDASTLCNADGNVVSHPSGNGTYDTAGEIPVANIIYTEINASFEGGDGTASDPYRIASARHIQNMSSVLKDGTAVYFELAADIDMAGIDWVPLNFADPYTKIVYLDGKGHTISNFYSSHQSYPSFFGVLYGECRNIRFVNARIEANSSSSSNGILGGYIGTTGKPGLVENSYIQGSINVVNGAPDGGIGGQINTGTVRNCYVDVTVETSDQHYGDINCGLGGITGDMRNNCTIENCFVTGKILGKYMFNTGGIAGRSNGSGIVIRNNISWMQEVNGRVAAGSVIGRWKTDQGTNENNFSNAETVVTTYENGGTGVTIAPYHPNDSDYADFGTETSDPCQTAGQLGWDTSIWDLSGSVPQLKLFLDI